MKNMNDFLANFINKSEQSNISENTNEDLEENIDENNTKINQIIQDANITIEDVLYDEEEGLENIEDQDLDFEYDQEVLDKYLKKDDLEQNLKDNQNIKEKNNREEIEQNELNNNINLNNKDDQDDQENIDILNKKENQFKNFDLKNLTDQSTIYKNNNILDKNQKLQISEKFNTNINEYINQVIGLKPQLAKILEISLSIDKQLKDELIINFAKSYINLYNMINDIFSSHFEKLRSNTLLDEENDIDYINVVDSLNVLKDIIEDNLSNFGIEVIRSDKEDSFSSKYMEITNLINSFYEDINNKEYKVLKSIRSGFVYENKVLQKEKVEIILDDNN